MYKKTLYISQGFRYRWDALPFHHCVGVPMYHHWFEDRMSWKNGLGQDWTSTVLSVGMRGLIIWKNREGPSPMAFNTLLYINV